MRRLHFATGTLGGGFCKANRKDPSLEWLESSHLLGHRIILKPAMRRVDTPLSPQTKESHGYFTIIATMSIANKATIQRIGLVGSRSRVRHDAGVAIRMHVWGSHDHKGCRT